MELLIGDESELDERPRTEIYTPTQNFPYMSDPKAHSSKQ